MKVEKKIANSITVTRPSYLNEHLFIINRSTHTQKNRPVILSTLVKSVVLLVVQLITCVH